MRNPSEMSHEVGVVHLSPASDVFRAAQAARRSLPAWASLTGAKRGEYLYKIAILLEQHIDEVANLASSEMGKPISELRGEVMRGVHLLKYYAAEGVRSNGDVIPSNECDVLQYSVRVPLGVVGIITPWNFPVAIPIWKLAPALICGNTVIWKPAENASLTATLLAELFVEAELPAGVVNVVMGRGSDVGDALVSQAIVDAISFTGSTSIGRQIAVKCADRNVKFQTEMGGKNAAIVLDDADLVKAVPAILSGAFRSAGQKCTATSRLIVQQGVAPALIKEITKAVAELAVGHALDATTYTGPVASQAQYQKVLSYVNLANTDGTIVAQGRSKVDPYSGFYVMPTVVSDIDADHALVQEEIFGPVTTLLTVPDYDAAVELCNRTLYGLSASLFTRDLSHALSFLNDVSAGMVRVNQETAGVEYQAPFGGMKQSSSHIREQGQAALTFYSQVKTCAIAY
ncbi:putative aldehyde dehydrogenase YcbD [Alicyclobacillus fastidiosus]|nr:putative aldehyde dehydrogenase YcbD [Alicyclobacillus fastidiosus]